MRPEELYLVDIVEAADAVARFVAGLEAVDFLKDELRQSAVLQKLTLIGEAAARLPEAIQSRYPDIEWYAIVGFRNIAIHEYFNVNWEIVWTTAIQDVPLLRQQVATILARDYGRG
jgi:uncharacterized protein with HEPN domain